MSRMRDNYNHASDSNMWLATDANVVIIRNQPQRIKFNLNHFQMHFGISPGNFEALSTRVEGRGRTNPSFRHDLLS